VTIQVVKNWLNRNLDHLEEDGILVVTKALSEAYPCPG
jgi:DNA-binding HxlR family transcriptional regulator